MSQRSIGEVIHGRHVNRDDVGYRAARRDDYEERLDRKYLGRDDHYRQPYRRRDGRRTLRELSAPFIIESPMCIMLNRCAENIEINGEVIHHLPKFEGMPDESPLTHLKEFHGVCMSMKSAMDSEENYKLKAFSFSLVSQAKSWLMSFPSGSIYSWEQLQRTFVDKYYPQFKAAQARKELYQLTQGSNETLFDYLERFRQLEESCPNHGIEKRMLLQHFMNGMDPRERRILNDSVQGSILDLYPEEIWELIEKATESSRYLEETHGSAPVATINVQNGFEEIKEMVTQLIAQNTQLMELNMQQGRTISELREQLAQTASAVSEMQDAEEKLPLQAIQPPISNVNAIMVKDEEHLDEDSMGMSNEEADKELWELFSKVETLLGEKVIGESVSTPIQRKMPIKCKDRGTLFIEAEGEVVNSSIHVSMQPPTNNVGNQALYTIEKIKPLPDHPKQKLFEKRKRAPRKKKSSKAQEVQYKEKYYHKKNVGKAPPKIIFGQVYHLPVKVKRNAFWIAKSNNFKLTNVGIERELKLSQLKELRQRVNENHQDYKARAQKFYERFGRTKRSRKFDLERPWDPNL